MGSAGRDLRAVVTQHLAFARQRSALAHGVGHGSADPWSTSSKIISGAARTRPARAAFRAGERASSPPDVALARERARIGRDLEFHPVHPPARPVLSPEGFDRHPQAGALQLRGGSSALTPRRSASRRPGAGRQAPAA